MDERATETRRCTMGRHGPTWYCEGTELQIRLGAWPDGVRVSVDARWQSGDRWVRLGGEYLPNLATSPDQLRVMPGGEHGRLECRVPAKAHAGYREGFVLDLEGGMFAELEAQLPAVFEAVALFLEVCLATGTERWNEGWVVQATAMCLMDGIAPAAAIEAAFPEASPSTGKRSDASTDVAVEELRCRLMAVLQQGSHRGRPEAAA